MIYTKAKITENTEIAGNYFLMRLFSREIPRHARAGQFVQIKTSDGVIPLLLRPFSFFEIDRKKNMFSILYQVKGAGTKSLSKKEPGEEINVLGPLGNYFSYPMAARKFILIAGGAGIAPLSCFADDLSRCKKDITVLLGLKEKSIFNFLKEHLKHLGPAKFLVCIEDGSVGFKGTVVSFFENVFSKQKYDFIASCGPNAMLKELRARLPAGRIPALCSMESHMSCGIGVCKGCVIKIDNHRGTLQRAPVYKRVCADGPIFDLRKINFE